MAIAALPDLPGRTLVRARTAALFGALFFGDVAGWVQMLVCTWIVLRGAHPAVWLPLLLVARGAPRLVVAPFAGALADRVDRVTLYRAVRLLALLPPLGLTLADTRLVPGTEPGILVAALVGSLIGAFDRPARRGLLWDVGGPARVLGAVSLSAAACHAASFLTPALAVLLVGALGTTGALAAAVAIEAAAAGCAWRFARACGQRPPPAAPERCHPLGGVGYLLRTPRALLLLCLTGAPSLAGRGLAIFLPLLIGGHAHASILGAGALASAPGLGALVAAVALAVVGEVSAKSRFALLCAVLFVTSLSLITLTSTVYERAALLALAGGCSASFGTVIVAMLHLQVPDHLRGRVMAL
jgi:hypothetical protein